ncbi:hypothetical protein F5ESL0263_08015 [Lactobacillus sp. ESL0263]|nr:hypothetical protein F5ESL0263_08015 [Lactobacillus sp. ESL0263]
MEINPSKIAAELLNRTFPFTLLVFFINKGTPLCICIQLSNYICISIFIIIFVYVPKASQEFVHLEG